MKAIAALALAACAAQPLEQIGIACTSDAQCPDGAWCNIGPNDDVCRSLDDSSPPVIVFDGFLINQQLVQTFTAQQHEVSIQTIELHNTGESDADVALAVTGPACTNAEWLGNGDHVDADQKFDDQIDVYPDVGCASPATITITATADSRPYTFSAMITIDP